MKTILLWLRKRCREPKQVGLATATCSALHIMDFAKMALAGEGTFYIVDAENVWRARRAIRDQKEGKLPADIQVSITNDRIIAIGENACKALHGAGESISKWGDRLNDQGRVYIRQSKAL